VICCKYALNPLACSQEYLPEDLGLARNITAQFGLGAIFVFCLSGFVFTHPLIGKGLWPQSELVIVSLFAAGALCGGVILLNRSKRLLSVCQHPVVLMPLLIGWASILFSLQTPFPLRSFLGAPELGEGAVWYLSLGLLTAFMLYIVQFKRLKIICSALAIAVALAVTLMTLKGEQIGLWRPYFFQDFLAFYGFFLIPIGLWGLQLKKSWQKALVTLLAIVPVVYSTNRVAQLLLLTAIPFVSIAYYLRKNVSYTKAIMVVGVFVTPILVVALISLIGASYTHEQGWYKLTMSLWSRYTLNLTAWLNWQELDWSARLFGQGWGAFTDVAASNIPLSQTKLFADSASHKNLWDGLARADFHSHAQLIEAIVSIGVVGALLVLLYPAIIVACTPQRRLPITCYWIFALAFLSATWFQFAITLAWLPLAIALSVQRVPIRTGVGKTIKQLSAYQYIIKGIIFLSAVICVASGVKNMQLARHSTQFAPPELSSVLPGKQCGDELGDMRFGGQRLAIVFHQVNSFMVRTEDADYPPDWMSRFAWMRCAVERYIAHGAGQRLQIVDLLGRQEWAFAERKQVNEPLVQEYLSTWESRLLPFIKQHPHRTDLAAHYMNWQLARGEEKAILSCAKAIYYRNPNDPVGLWFLGIVELAIPGKGDIGMKKMRLALQNGIQDIIPIEQAMIDQLNQLV
jgi:hypothetical protein